ncbi:replication protein A 70 kDa DNA-binding subunit-like [Ipomoea triloba]|uniref:replication protein A 70 kDa DNA-binding subunit-like n=1 Tax=Ipomoea triloba TaxID=35885 RepID=UPI00125D602F|nr:replication protein A 70 kDa DNA-binding subunit-like [Ipomoea triloba]
MGMYSVATELSTFKKTSAIKARVIRTYLVPLRKGSSEIKSKEIVFHDSEGTVIHATIPKSLLDKFINSFEECKVYAVKNFFVVSNYLFYKTSLHEYMMQFNHDTIWKEIRSDNIPWHMYRLKSSPSLRGNPSLNEKELIDIIGRVVEIHAPQQKTFGGHNAKLIDFVLEDSLGNRISCTFWDDYVPKIEAYYQSELTDPVVVLIQFCRIKYGVRDGDVKICSAYDVTQALFDLDSQEFKTFRESLRDPEYQTPMRSIASLSSLSYNNTFDESTSHGMDLVTITELYGMDKIGEFWVAAKINGIETPNDWFYLSCPRKGCNKKLKVSEGVLKCFKCNTTWEDGVLRFKVKLRVVDMKGNASFMLWDRECFELIGIAASDLHELHKDTTKPPKQIQDLVNRCMLFRISAKTEHISKLDSAFPVFKINTDQQLLKQHCPEILGIPEEEVNTKMLSLEDDEIREGFLSDEADSPIATLPPFSGEAADGSVKRSLIDEFSSTQGCKKVKQHRVKVEKID